MRQESITRIRQTARTMGNEEVMKGISDCVQGFWECTGFDAHDKARDSQCWIALYALEAQRRGLVAPQDWDDLVRDSIGWFCKTHPGAFELL